MDNKTIPRLSNFNNKCYIRTFTERLKFNHDLLFAEIQLLSIDEFGLVYNACNILGYVARPTG